MGKRALPASLRAVLKLDPLYVFDSEWGRCLDRLRAKVPPAELRKLFALYLAMRQRISEYRKHDVLEKMQKFLAGCSVAARKPAATDPAFAPVYRAFFHTLFTKKCTAENAAAKLGIRPNWGLSITERSASQRVHCQYHRSLSSVLKAKRIPVQDPELILQYLTHPARKRPEQCRVYTVSFNSVMTLTDVKLWADMHQGQFADAWCLLAFLAARTIPKGVQVVTQTTFENLLSSWLVSCVNTAGKRELIIREPFVRSVHHVMAPVRHLGARLFRNQRCDEVSDLHFSSGTLFLLCKTH